MVRFFWNFGFRVYKYQIHFSATCPNEIQSSQNPYPWYFYSLFTYKSRQYLLWKIWLSGTVRVPQPMEEDWKFSTLIFWLLDVSTTYVHDIRPKSFAQISFVFSKSKEKCYESKISISNKKFCFGCFIHQKGPTLVLLGQVDVSVSRNGLQLKFYKLLVKLLRN